MKDNQIIDLNHTMNKLNCSKEMVLEIFQIFCDDLSSNLILIKNAYAENDIQKTRDILHKIKGGLCFCDAPRLRKVADRLHDEVKKGTDLSLLESLYNEFYQEIDIVFDEFKNIKKNNIQRIRKNSL